MSGDGVRQSNISQYLWEEEGARPLSPHQTKPFLKLIETSRDRETFTKIVEVHHSYVPTSSYGGRQINWMIYDQQNTIKGVIGIGSAIMAMEDRDRYIGW